MPSRSDAISLFGYRHHPRTTIESVGPRGRRDDAYRTAHVPIIRRGLDLRRLFSARSLWPALAVLVACVPFAGGFSVTNIFYIRDLTMFFWPRHLWILRSLMS